MSGLTAVEALEALRVRGLDYRPDLRQPDGLWAAQCPCCIAVTGERVLAIAESRHGGRVTLRCRFVRDCSSDEIEQRLRDALAPVSWSEALVLAEDARAVAARALALAESALSEREDLAVAA